MAEIVCVSCWQGFESDAEDVEEVTCPACSHVQPALGGQEAPEQAKPADSPKAASASSAGGEKDPFEEIAEEMVFDMEEGTEENPSLAETADFVQVSSDSSESTEEPSASAEEPIASAEEPIASAEEPIEIAEPESTEALMGELLSAEEEDRRWRFRSGSGLVLFFPEYEVAQKWAVKQDPAELAIAYGTGEFRSYPVFCAALKLLGDPVAAIRAEEEEEAEGSGATERSDPLDPLSQAEPVDSVQEVSPPSNAPGDKSAPGPRTTTLTSEFKFRTGEEKSVWPARVLFLVLGLALGGGVVYGAGWYGMLPGLLY